MSRELFQLLLRDVLPLLATDEAFFPSAVRTAFGKCAIVRFLFAADAAFLMFFFAALFCFVEAMFPHSVDPIRPMFDAASTSEGSFQNLHARS
jgi:hypothetical protein